MMATLVGISIFVIVIATILAIFIIDGEAAAYVFITLSVISVMGFVAYRDSQRPSRDDLIGIVKDAGITGHVDYEQLLFDHYYHMSDGTVLIWENNVLTVKE